tara:strand:- start:15004 stop:15771 length:768 start_codon:yes stop_codon:yes gene_type:complete
MISKCIVSTWTHSSYDDVWPMYYGQYEEMAPFFKHCVIINEKSDKINPGFKQIVNIETDPFYKRLTESLEHIEEDIVLFSLEDFVLYSAVEETKISNMINYLIDSDYDFIRLIRSGINESHTGPNKLVNKDLNLYEVPFSCEYLYSLQATLWKKKSLINHFNSYKPKNFYEAEIKGSHAARKLNLKGLFVWNNDKLCQGDVTAAHSDSSTFPYMSSALHGASYGNPSKWQTSLYRERLKPLFKKYNIDPAIRGEC